MLQDSYRYLSALQGGDSFCRGPRGRRGGEGGDTLSDGGSPDRLFVEPWILALRSIHNELDAVSLYEVDDIRTAFLHFVYTLHRQAGILQDVCSAMRGDDIEAKLHETFSQIG